MITAIAILGPTASGKSELAMEVALRSGGEILSVDSRQSYRRLDIGTAKPLIEDRRRVPHHLIDILELHERSNAVRFAETAHAAVREIVSRGAFPIFVGGSGLYFRAIAEGLFCVRLDAARRADFAESVRGVSDEVLYGRLEAVDAESARRVHRRDRFRIVRALEVYSLTGTPLTELQRRGGTEPAGEQIRFVKIGLELPRAELHRRIEHRTRAMFERGWRRETEELLASGVDPDWPGMKTLGYPEMVRFIDGRSTFDETFGWIVERTRQYAKRQITWFRKEPDTTWLAGSAQELLGRTMALVRAAVGG
jgi:tRNA dimethylallyltransferase